MGVLSCARRGCERIMCDTYVDGVGYVCMECEDEFKNHFKFAGLANNSRNDITESLRSFMETEKDSMHTDIDSVDEFFDRYRQNQ